MAVDLEKSGINWGVFFSQEAIEERFLGQVYRAVHSRGNRRQVITRVNEETGQVQSEHKFIDQTTGLPKSEGDLLPPGLALVGPSLVLQRIIRPEKLAICDLISDDPTPLDYCEGCSREHSGIHMEWKPRAQWSEMEAAAVSRAEYAWKKALIVMESKGWVRFERPASGVFEGDPEMRRRYADALGKDGLPRVARLTHEAIDAAEKQIPGTDQARGAFSHLARAPRAVKDHAAREIPWADRLMKNEKAGT